jgi:hypothetical protein
VQLTVRRNDFFPAVGDQKMDEQAVAVVRTDGGDLQTETIDLAHALFAQRQTDRSGWRFSGPVERRVTQ